MKHRWMILTCAALSSASLSCRDASDREVGVVARAGDYVLTVDEVVAMMADQEQLPAQSNVVEALADLWIDYTLLAAAAAEDSTFSDLDLRPLVQRQLDQTMLVQLRDSVIQVDTVVSDAELRSMYESDALDVQFRARHIMLQYPFEATPTQRDSVHAQIEGIRQRIVGGASFETLARQFSQDPGSAGTGGDLGYFSRGELVKPFEDAVSALQPGEVSEVVETPMGLHVIRLDERRSQDFSDVVDEFRPRVVADRVAAAESTFVAALETRAGEPALTDDALVVTREVSGDPATRLSGGAMRRPLLTWDGGAYTVGELQELLQFEQPTFHQQVASGSDEEIESFLRGLARRKLLIAEARSAGLEPPRVRVDSLLASAAEQLRSAARRLGLLPLDRAPGEAVERAVTRAVRDALEKNLSGATQVIPLGVVRYQLRREAAYSVSGTGVGQAILAVGDMRSTRGASPLEEAPAGADQPGDSAGR